jgi:hypothetical protein
VIAFGTLPLSSDPGLVLVDPVSGARTPGRAYFAETLAHHRDLSPIVCWRADYTAECLSPVGTTLPAVALRGSVSQI